MKQQLAATQAPASTAVGDAAFAEAQVAALAVVPSQYADYAATNLPEILTQSRQKGVKTPHQVAYILATAEHESGFGTPKYKRSESLVEDSNPFVEHPGAKKGREWSAETHAGSNAGGTVRAGSKEELETKYWDSCYGGRLGNERGTSDASNFRGRGFVQLTGRDNYKKLSDVLNEEGFTYTLDGTTYGGKDNPIDLTANPTHVNKVPALAARVLVTGMMGGNFSGAALGDYVNDKNANYTGARAVVNGSDQAAAIAIYARRYEKVLVKDNVWKRVFEQEKPTASPGPQADGGTVAPAGPT